MKTLESIAIALIVIVAVASAASAQIKITDTETTKLYMTLATVGTAQALDHENAFGANGAPLAKVSPGFQNAFGDLGFVAKFGKNEEIEVVFDMYLSSRNHPSQTYGNEGYIILRGVPENLQGLKFLEPVLKKVDLKAGHMLVDFGDAAQHRTNNAIAQKNPLVGNFVIDPNIVSIGMQASSKPGSRVGWLVGASNGTTTEDWNVGRGFALNGKLIFYPVESLRTSVSYITTDQSDNPTKAAGGSSMQMFTGNRSGERYAGVLGGGQAPGNVFPQAGEKYTLVGQAPIKMTQYGIKPPTAMLGTRHSLRFDHDLHLPLRAREREDAGDRRAIEAVVDVVLDAADELRELELDHRMFVGAKRVVHVALHLPIAAAQRREDRGPRAGRRPRGRAGAPPHRTRNARRPRASPRLREHESAGGGDVSQAREGRRSGGTTPRARDVRTPGVQRRA